MGSEDATRNRVIEVLGAFGHIVAVENPSVPGTPDVNGCIDGADFWIELKQRDTWPARKATPVTFDHYTDLQRLWAGARLRAGGHMFLLIQVRRDYFLFNDARQVLIGRKNREWITKNAAAHWVNSFDGLTFVRLLQNDY